MKWENAIAAPHQKVRNASSNGMQSQHFDAFCLSGTTSFHFSAVMNKTCIDMPRELEILWPSPAFCPLSPALAEFVNFAASPFAKQNKKWSAYRTYIHICWSVCGRKFQVPSPPEGLPETPSALFTTRASPGRLGLQWKHLSKTPSDSVCKVCRAAHLLKLSTFSSPSICCVHSRT